MSKNRMEAFSDGVIAILITIMVLGLTVPKGVDLADLAPLGPVFLSYVLSFALLFTLSLVPFTTAWMGETTFAPVTTPSFVPRTVLPPNAFVARSTARSAACCGRAGFSSTATVASDRGDRSRHREGAAP
jgi:uncharacterized membrane protein